MHSESSEQRSPHILDIVESKLPSEILENTLKTFCLIEDGSTLPESFRRAFARYEIAIVNQPVLKKVAREREWQKMKNATSKLIDALDNLPPDLMKSLKLEITFDAIINLDFENEKKERPKINPDQLPLLQRELECLLRAINRMADYEKSPNPKATPLDTPLNNLIRNFLDLWPLGAGKPTVYYEDASQSYRGSFFDLTLSLFKEYFDTSIYQSEQALGKRIVRLIDLRNGKDTR